MKILFATSEMVPLVKTGGLADVSGALPQALAGLGHDVVVVMPFYGAIDRKARPLEMIIPKLDVDLPAGKRTMAVWRTWLGEATQEQRAAVHLIDDRGLFDRPQLYGTGAGDYPDNALRYGYYALAAIWMLKGLGWIPDVIIANDWQTALIPINLKLHPEVAADPELHSIPILYCIHNISYQGIFEHYLIDHLGLPSSAFHLAALEYHGHFNLLKGGIVTSDWIATVSPTYAREIQRHSYGFGLDGVIRSRRDQLTGILNGIDIADWDPATDPALPAHFSVEDLSGKAACKRALQQRFGLPVEPETPLLSMVGRLVDQKGCDLLVRVLPELLRDQVQFVLLGSGQAEYHEFFDALAARYPDKVGVELGFDDRLARQIEAGADLFLMPSRFEPCGLNQLYSLRYGTVPVVRRTGGLADSIVDATPATLADCRATGFVFDNYTPNELSDAIKRALLLYRSDPVAWRRLVLTGMQQDFSWDRSAREYERLIAGMNRPSSA